MPPLPSGASSGGTKRRARRSRDVEIPITFLTQDDLTPSVFSRELEGDELGVKASVIFIDAAPGDGPSLHVHPYAELFFLLEGQAAFSDGVHERLVSAGGVVIVPAEEPHAFTNPGPGRLRQIDVHLSGHFTTRWLTDLGGLPRD